ncbi:hypothetical protein CHARACLAT_028461 [Characodon lateralis]|uniref:Uncharacterized protein n=1 Tax=Characodon lateralis TaxID=208331 RepID=A0ABU7EP58_9TELE|nr:hypothetical protein [Characodon lateralis]
MRLRWYTIKPTNTHTHRRGEEKLGPRFSTVWPGNKQLCLRESHPSPHKQTQPVKISLLLSGSPLSSDTEDEDAEDILPSLSPPCQSFCKIPTSHPTPAGF